MILRNGKIQRKSVGILVVVISILISSTAYADTLEIIMQPSELLRQGNLYLEKGEIGKAKKSLKRALKSNLTDRQRATTMNSLCVAHLKEESWRKAEKLCDEAIKIFPVDWRFYNNRGNVYFGLGKLQAAIEQYEKGREFAPDSLILASNIELATARYEKSRNRTKSN